MVTDKICYQLQTLYISFIGIILIWNLAIWGWVTSDTVPCYHKLGYLPVSAVEGYSVTVTWNDDPPISRGPDNYHRMTGVGSQTQNSGQ